MSAGEVIKHARPAPIAGLMNRAKKTVGGPYSRWDVIGIGVRRHHAVIKGRQ